MAEVVPREAKQAVERFSAGRGMVKRSLLLRSGRVASTAESRHLTMGEVKTERLGALFYDSWLRRRKAPANLLTKSLTIVDLFSGCGGMSVGAHEAARATGHHAVHVLAADTNRAALSVFGANFPEAELLTTPIEQLVDGELGTRKTSSERGLSEKLAGLDLLIGGPPCQGHSDLNNHTRRQDPRNSLYLRMARFVEVVRPRLVVIENVPGVKHDKSGALAKTVDALHSAGYQVNHGVVAAADFGASQSRKRHILLASRDACVTPNVDRLRIEFGAPARSVMDAIGDLGLQPERGIFGTAAQHSAINEQRIRYLFENQVWELPDSQRPDCHRLRPHTYGAVYGRMYADRPAPTITAGFGSTGQGRFVHPKEPRTLTPHEAARLQGFPDWFDFSAAPGRRALQEMIGNAVPSRLAYVAIASLLR